MPLINPYHPGTNEHVDFEIWNNGVERFNDPARRYSKNTRQPHELDYLRGFHDPVTLAAIKARIAAVTGSYVNVTSLWLDKTAYVYPKSQHISSKTRRELADLAVVLRDCSSGWPTLRTMWLLQAKKGDNPASSLPSNPSTKKEIELFEQSPQFELESWSKPKTKLFFDLEPEFGSPQNSANFRHWSFLMFRETPNVPTSGGSSPAQWRWSGSDQNPLIGSFMEGITQMLLHPRNPDHKGEWLFTRSSTGWTALYHALMRHMPSHHFLRHAGGPMRITSFSSSQSRFSSFGQFVLNNPYLRQILPNSKHNFRHLFSSSAFKSDLISTGFYRSQGLQDWKMEMSFDDFWQDVEKNIGKSIDHAIDSEDSDYAPERNNDIDFSGGGGRPPGNNADDGDERSSYPARSTLLIDIHR